MATASSSSVDDFPLLCENCLGPNPLVRMTKQFGAKPCKVCDRAFPVFRWQPGPQARFKKTELCRTCAALQHVCQTCVLDLTLGVPVAVRDSLLENSQRVEIPQSASGRAHLIDRVEAQLAASGGSDRDLLDGVSKASKASAVLQKLARRNLSSPYYERNSAHYCSFFAAGKCSRGDHCSFRHEIRPANEALAKQNIRDRYDGSQDPVAQKLLDRHHHQGELPFPSEPLSPPEDQNVRTLWLGALPPTATRDSILLSFHDFSDSVENVHLVDSKGCAFVRFNERQAAQAAAERLNGKIKVDGKFVRMQWGKSAQNNQSGEQQNYGESEIKTEREKSSVSTAPTGPPSTSSRSLAAPPGIRPKASQPLYPSQAPLSSLTNSSV